MPASGARRLPVWQFSDQIAGIPGGSGLKIVTDAPARCRFSVDDWQTYHDVKLKPAGGGLYATRIGGKQLAGVRGIEFTFLWLDSDEWEGRNFNVAVGE